MRTRDPGNDLWGWQHNKVGSCSRQLVYGDVGPLLVPYSRPPPLPRPSQLNHHVLWKWWKIITIKPEIIRCTCVSKRHINTEQLRLARVTRHKRSPCVLLRVLYPLVTGWPDKRKSWKGLILTTHATPCRHIHWTLVEVTRDSHLGLIRSWISQLEIKVRGQ